MCLCFITYVTFLFLLVFLFHGCLKTLVLRLKGDRWVRADVALYFVCLNGRLVEAVIALLCNEGRMVVRV